MIYSQRDPKWANILIKDMMIGQVGCTSTVASEIIGCTPDVFVKRMKALPVINDRNGSYTGFLGNNIVWARIMEAFPGIKVFRYFSYDNNAVKALTPNVIVEVPAKPIGGTGKHWVRYMGNQRLHDPWTGTDRPTSDFLGATGYAVFSGKWIQPSVDPYEVTVNQCRTACDEPTSAVNKINQIKYLVSKI